MFAFEHNNWRKSCAISADSGNHSCVLMVDLTLLVLGLLSLPSNDLLLLSNSSHHSALISPVDIPFLESIFFIQLLKIS
jgi:hypothetical protein